MYLTWVPMVVTIISKMVQADELLSARCQAKCLHDLEMRAKDDNELKRQLKHHIVNLCKDEANCSSVSYFCMFSSMCAEYCLRESSKAAPEMVEISVRQNKLLAVTLLNLRLFLNVWLLSGNLR
uniref:Chondroitin proteoglycan 4 domain-containing protein n=1 Tax=Ascaris lumbricoides TaxID=6252 RepID=A0A9J2PL28_ASCLU